MNKKEKMITDINQLDLAKHIPMQIIIRGNLTKE